MINGIASDMIISKRGSRQVDPLSPLLFVLVGNTFSKLLELAIHNEIYQDS